MNHPRCVLYTTVHFCTGIEVAGVRDAGKEEIEVDVKCVRANGDFVSTGGGLEHRGSDCNCIDERHERSDKREKGILARYSIPQGVEPHLAG